MQVLSWHQCAMERLGSVKVLKHLKTNIILFTLAIDQQPWKYLTFDIKLNNHSQINESKYYDLEVFIWNKTG